MVASALNAAELVSYTPNWLYSRGPGLKGPDCPKRDKNADANL